MTKLENKKIMKRIIFDVDGTLTITNPSLDYLQVEPNWEIVEKLKQYKEAGYEIVLFTSRNMRTYNCNVGKINANTLPKLINWLHKHSIPYDEIFVGKPWCGTDGFYVDDKAIRPSEFLKLEEEEIQSIVKNK